MIFCVSHKNQMLSCYALREKLFTFTNRCSPALSDRRNGTSRPFVAQDDTNFYLGKINRLHCALRLYSTHSSPLQAAQNVAATCARHIACIH